MFCEKCGKEIMEGAVFCEECGAAVKKEMNILENENQHFGLSRKIWLSSQTNHGVQTRVPL